MNKLSEVVRAYRDEQGLSLRDFAAQLSAELPQDGISYQSVRNWETGEHAPNYHLLVTLMMHSGGWQRDFAFDCLAAINPEYYKPAGRIGRVILEYQNENN